MNNENKINSVLEMLKESIKILNDLKGRNPHLNSAVQNANRAVNNVINANGNIGEFNVEKDIADLFKVINTSKIPEIGSLRKDLRFIKRNIKDKKEKLEKLTLFIVINKHSLREIGVDENLLKKYISKFNENIKVNNLQGGARYVNIKNVGRRLVRLSKNGRQYAIVNGKKKYL